MPKPTTVFKNVACDCVFFDGVSAVICAFLYLEIGSLFDRFGGFRRIVDAG